MPYTLKPIPEHWDLNYLDYGWDDKLTDPLSNILMEKCPLFQITNKEEAKSYIYGMFKEITVDQYYELIRIYFSVDNNQVDKYNSNKDIVKMNKRKAKQVGGNRPDTNDPVYRLLEMADSYHDFKDNTYDYFKNILNYDIPKELGQNDITNEKNFISAVSSKPNLTFSNNNVIPNPLYGFNIKTYNLVDRIRDNPHYKFIDLVNSQEKSISYHRSRAEKFISVDLWAQYRTGGKNKFYELRQLVELCGFIKKWFTNYNFHRDNSHIVTHIILILSYVENVFYTTFSDDENVKTHLWNYLTESQQKQIDWKLAIADINIYDGSIFWQRELDYTNNTGYIYGGNVPLDNDIGIHSLQPFDMAYFSTLVDMDAINEYRDSHLKVNVEIIENSNVVFNEVLDMYQCKELFSTSVIKLLINGKRYNYQNYVEMVFYLKIVNTNNESPRFATEVLPYLKQIYDSCSIEMLYRLKRVADWGQVEHCKAYNKVFVTMDKLASLYAYYRKVPFIYMRPEDQALDSSNRVGIDEDPEFIQISHVLYSNH
jgi:hypothetical protein